MNVMEVKNKEGSIGWTFVRSRVNHCSKANEELLRRLLRFRKFLCDYGFYLPLLVHKLWKSVLRRKFCINFLP